MRHACVRHRECTRGATILYSKRHKVHRHKLYTRAVVLGVAHFLLLFSSFSYPLNVQHSSLLSRCHACVGAHTVQLYARVDVKVPCCEVTWLNHPRPSIINYILSLPFYFLSCCYNRSYSFHTGIATVDPWQQPVSKFVC